MTIINKGDFVEIEFTGYANNEVFDTTIPKKAKELGLNADVKPVVASAGNEMVLKGLDEALIGKEIGPDYKIKLEPKDAFGQRNASLIKTIPLKVFREKNINPIPGMAFQIDGNIARILSSNGGRIMVDFNNPLAGKVVEYEFKLLRKITSNEDKVNALQDFFFRKRFEFVIKENTVIFKKEVKPILDMLGKKLEELSNLKFIIKEEKKSDLKEN
jgi:FKBP-type peptidyl-prolyl cis-trans isomerase 2